MKLLKQSPCMGSYYSLNLTSHSILKYMSHNVFVLLYIYSAKGLHLTTKNLQMSKDLYIMSMTLQVEIYKFNGLWIENFKHDKTSN